MLKTNLYLTPKTMILEVFLINQTISHKNIYNQILYKNNHESEACISNAHTVICNNELDDIDTSFSETLKNAAIGANKGRNIRSSKFLKKT